MAMAQVGIGTLQPDKSALLDIEAAPNNLKGVLIPRVPLVSTTDNSNINNGKTASSLLVFNTTTNESVTPGYYYWFGNQWVRIISATDPLLNNFAINEELAVDLVKETLFLRDSKNHIVSVPLSEINILTTFESTGSGQYTYTSEDNTKTILSIPDEVISNISIILENEQVVNEIYEVIAAQGKELKGDGIISVTGGNQAVLHATSLGIKDYSITNTKLIATSNDAGKALVVGADGKLNYVLLDDTNTVISRFEIDNTGKFLELEDSATLNFSVPIQDLNILTTLANLQDGSYIYINEMGDSVTINVVADVIKNIQTILGDTIVATEVYETVAAKGKVLRSTEGSILVTGGGKAVLEATQIDIADGGVKTNKIANQAVTEDKLGAPATSPAASVPAVQADRSVKYQPIGTLLAAEATDLKSSDGTIQILDVNGQAGGIKAVLQNVNLSLADEAVTTAKIADKNVTAIKLDGGNGADNRVAVSNATGLVTYKPFTTDLISDSGSITTDGIVAVTDGTGASLKDITLSIEDNSVEATKLAATGANSGNVLTADGSGKVSYQPITSSTITDSKKLTTDGIITVNNLASNELDKAVLQPIELGVKDQGISTVKIADKNVTAIKLDGGNGADNRVAVSNATGVVTYKPFTTDLISDSGSITSDNIIEVADGSDAVLKDLSLSIKENSIDADRLKASGVNSGTVLTADGSGKVSYQPITSSTITDSKKLTTDGIITVNNLASNELDKAVLQPIELGVKDQGISTVKIADKNVTAIKLDGGNGAANRVAVSDSLGVVNYVLLTNDLIANPGSITSDNIIEVADGSDAVLKDLSLSIKENSIDADRLKASGVNSGTVLTADGSGKVSYQPITSSTITDSKKLTTDGIITVNNLASNELDKAVLQPIELGVKDQGISTAKIADEAVTTAKIKLQGVTEDKLGAPATSPAASVPAVQADRSVKYQPIGTLLAAEATDLKSSDGTIQILDVNGQAGGVKAVLQNVNLSLADGSVSTPKLIDHAVTEEKLWAGLQKENYIPVAQSSGAVIYQSLESIQEGKALTIDNSLKITGVATEALLNPIGLEVNTAGIITKHIEDKAVVAAKIGSENAAIGTVLSSMGNGSTSFVPSRNLVEEVMKGDIQGDQVSIQVASGVNTVFGNNGEDVTISLIASGVKERHLATESVTKDKVATNAISTVKIENKAVTAVKLDGGNGAANRVAVSDATGVVTYKPFTTDLISNSGNITTDGIVAVTDGTGATLKDITLSIADNSVEATKLAATGAASGMVLTADGNGAVSYEPLLSEQISNSTALTSDGIVTLNGSTSAVGKSVLKDVVLGIKDLGIATSKLADTAVTTSKLAEQAVTIVKLGSEDEVKDQILLTDGQGGFIYSTIDAVQADGQDLTTDGIIGFASGDGENAVLVPTKLQINDGSIPNEKIKNNTITKGKLNSETQPLNMLLVTDGHGGFDYVVKEAVQAGGEDLDVGTALEFTAGDGKNIVLAPTTIDVKDLGITEAKLATDAVSTVKIKNLAVSVDKMNSIVEGNPMSSSNVLVADGQGGVGFEDMEQLVLDQGKDLTSDGSLSIPTNNKSLLKGTSIKVAPLGIKNEHIAAHAVTTTNISSKEGTANAAEHTVLTADGQGNATFVSVDRLVFDQGADVNSPEGTILVTDGVKAALSPMQLDIATSGVQNKHIANLAVTSSKINSEGSSEHYVLSADGEGGAAFMSITDVATSEAHDLQGSSSIEVTNGVKAIFRDAVVHVKDLGITNEKIATQTIKAIKMDSETNAEGTVLTALGDGEAKYLSLDTYGKALTPDASIVVTNGEKALLDAASIRVNNSGILNNHIGAQQVTANKISSVVNASNVTDDHVLAADGQGGAVYKNVGSFLENHGKEMTSDGSIAVVSGNKSLIKETEIKIADAGVKANHIDVKQVDETKFSTTGKAKGTVLVADGVGGASYEAIKAMMPKFFYMPSIALDVKPNLSGNRNIYQEYVTQFGTPMVANPGAQSGGSSASLPVLPATELNFFITYYDTAIFENVTLSNDGILTYKVKVDAVISGQSFMNIVLAVKE